MTLAEPEQEPVAWVLALPDGRLDRLSVVAYDDEAEEMLQRSIAGCTLVPLYPAPPQQQAEPPSEWPLIKNILDEYGLQAISFVAEWKAAQQHAEPANSYKLDSTKAAVVATEFYWLPIDQNTPRGVKILLLGRGGVASLGHYHHKLGESHFWTHWAPLPRRAPDNN